MSHQAGLDLGSTYSAAALSGSDGVVRLETLVPSVVFANEDGSFSFGEDAEHHAPADPGRVARGFARRVGDATPLLLGDNAVPAEVVAARFAAQLLDSLPVRPSKVAIAHPANWGGHRLQSLRTALAAQGIGDALFVPDPLAAVQAYAIRERVEPGMAVAVYDLGGARFDAAVVRKADHARFVLAGEPEEIEVGGLDFDEAVYEHVTATLRPAWDELDPEDPAVLAGVAAVRRDCVAAKEKLSADTEVLIPVVLPGMDTVVRLGRAEFEELIRPAVDETVAALRRAMNSAGTTAEELAAVLLVGGSSRVPLVTQAVSAQLGRPVTVALDPQGMIAIGAALAARGRETEPATIIRPQWTRPPLPVGPVLPAKRSRRGFVAGLAAAVVAMAVAGGVTFASTRITPVDADADVTPTTVVSTGETTVAPPVPTTTPPPAPRPRTQAPPPPVRTTTRPVTTTRPSSTTTTTTTTSTTTTSGSTSGSSSTKAGAP